MSKQMKIRSPSSAKCSYASFPLSKLMNAPKTVFSFHTHQSLPATANATGVHAQLETPVTLSPSYGCKAPMCHKPSRLALLSQVPMATDRVCPMVMYLTEADLNGKITSVQNLYVGQTGLIPEVPLRHQLAVTNEFDLWSLHGFSG